MLEEDWTRSLSQMMRVSVDAVVLNDAVTASGASSLAKSTRRSKQISRRYHHVQRVFRQRVS